MLLVCRTIMHIQLVALHNIMVLVVYTHTSHDHRPLRERCGWSP